MNAPRRPRQVCPVPKARLLDLALKVIVETAGAGRRHANLDVDAFEIVFCGQRDAAAAGATVHEIAAGIIRDTLRTRPLRRGSNIDFAGAALELLAALNDYELRWFDFDAFVAWEDADSGDLVRGTDLDAAIRDWLSSALETTEDDDLPWSTDPPSPLRAFIGGARTGLDEAARQTVRELAEAATHELRRLGFVVYCPILAPDTSGADDEISERDLDELAHGDLLLLLATPPAHGVGMLLAYSDRTRPHVLIAGDQGAPITPLTACQRRRSDALPGSTSEDLLESLHDVLRRTRPLLRLHSALRKQLLASPPEEFLRLQRAWRASGVAVSDLAGIPSWRFEQILNSPVHHQSATVEELSLLRRQLGLLDGPATDLAGLSGAQDDLGVVPAKSSAARAAPDSVPVPPFGQEVDVTRDTSASEVADGAAIVRLSLFDGFDDRLPPPGWERGRWLTMAETNAARRAAKEMGLSEQDCDDLLWCGARYRAVEYSHPVGTRELLALEDPREWKHLWNVSGRRQ